jgi:ATP-binding cassette subfamily F protein 3
VLVLDEPTNHLDIPSREALETTLGSFDGTILCVSHDRYFLDRVAKRLLILRPPEIVDFDDTYSAWTRKVAQTVAEQRSAASSKNAAPAKSKAAPAPTPARVTAGAGANSNAKRRDNPYSRPFGRLTLKELEQQISDTEVALAECQSNFGDAGSFRDPNKSQRLQAELKTLSAKLEALEAEYFAREQ